MTTLEAQNIAEKYTIKFSQQITGFTIGLTNPRSFQNYFCFDFALVDFKRSEAPKYFEGKSGVIVDKKTRLPRLVTSTELDLLQRNQNELERIYRFITKSNDPTDLIFLKKIFQLTPEQFTSFQQDIVDSKENKEKILSIIQHLLDTQSNGN